MPVTDTITYQVADEAGAPISAAQAKSAGQRIVLDEDVPNASTDLLLAMNFDVSKVESIFLLSDRNLTIETNNGSTPANTINLLANVPFVWQRNTYMANPFTANVTAFFLTNNSGGTARLRGRILTDPT